MCIDDNECDRPAKDNKPTPNSVAATDWHRE